MAHLTYLFCRILYPTKHAGYGANLYSRRDSRGDFADLTLQRWRVPNGVSYAQSRSALLARPSGKPSEETMDRKTLTRTILAGCVLALALDASGQATSAGATQTSNANGNTTSPKNASHKHHQHHAASHKMSNGTQHKPMGSGSSASSSETAYRLALRQCVEGPMGRRDSCLDDAIARYGRS